MLLFLILFAPAPLPNNNTINPELIVGSYLEHSVEVGLHIHQIHTFHPNGDWESIPVTLARGKDVYTAAFFGKWKIAQNKLHTTAHSALWLSNHLPIEIETYVPPPTWIYHPTKVSQRILHGTIQSPYRPQHGSFQFIRK